MSRILVVTPYPPGRDGIAAYAVQQVAALRGAGHEVTVLSPGPSAAHFHLALVGARGGLSLAKHIRAGGYDRVIIQFHPDFFYPIGCSTAERGQVSAALTAAFAAARRVEVYVHEIDYRQGPGLGGLPMRLMWRRVDAIFVHTPSERDEFVAAFGVDADRVHVVNHGEDFARNTTMDRAAARESLGIGTDDFLFLSIGFIQEHKGFDRAVSAFDGLAARGRFRYAIVGSVRVDEPSFLTYLEKLRRLVEETEGAELHDVFVTDELFDRWIVASDAVVLPYRAIWSSGVLERARLYSRPVIATAVGGLAEQTGDASLVTLVQDDFELRSAMWAAAGVLSTAEQSADWAAPWAHIADVDAGAIQRELEARAATLRENGIRHTNDSPGTTAFRRSARDESAASSPRPAVRADARLRALPVTVLPAARSRIPGGRGVKRIISRLTRWQVQPLADQLNALRAATADAVEQVERRR